MDIDRLKEELKKSAVPCPTTEHAVGYNKGIGQALMLIEKLEIEEKQDG